MKLFDRVKLKEDFAVPLRGIKLCKGMIGTVRKIEDSEVHLQLVIPNILKFTIVPDILLENCTEADIEPLDYTLATPQIFHKGNIWSIKVGVDDDGNPFYKTGVIIDYKLNLNEENDDIYIAFLNDICDWQDVLIEDIPAVCYKKKYLDLFCSYTSVIS